MQALQLASAFLAHLQMVVLPESLQTFWVCDRTTNNFGHLSGANDGFHQGLDLLPIDSHGDLVHAKHKSRNMLAAQSLSDGCLELERKLTGENLTWLHDHEQDNRFIGIVRSASADAESG